MPSAIANRALGLVETGRVSDALALLEPVAAEGEPAVLDALGQCYLVAHRYGDATRAFEQAIRGGAGESWHGLGCALLGQKSFGAAAAALARLPPASQSLATGYRMGDALFHLGLVDDACAHFEAACRASDRTLAALARRTLACAITASAAAGQARVRDAKQAWLAGETLFPQANRPREPGRKLRIAYFTSVFGSRNYMMPVLPMIGHHDRSRFEIHLICDGAAPTAASGYCEHDEDRIWQVKGIGNEALCAAIAEAGIDVLVDMNGYTVPGRLAVSLSRPAPVVVGWVNMFATTGSAAFDSIVGDAAVIYPEDEPFYPEPVDRVPGSYLAFEVNFPTPAIVPPPCLASGAITFGSLASNYKLDEGVIAAWTALLLAVPSTRLLVRNELLTDPSTQAHLRSRFAGIDQDRITLLGRAAPDAFLATYDEIDIALDTFPYSGGTTTTEALWQGVPVLALTGDRWAARTSASILLAAGLEQWVVPDEATYTARAIALAQDAATPARLAALRSTMREKLRASAACDVAGLCRALEALYERLSAKA